MPAAAPPEPPEPPTEAVPAPVATSAAPRPSGDALDLGGTVIPVLVRSYLPYGVLAALGIVVGYLIGRRRLR
jgi:hypothetical protein